MLSNDAGRIAAAIVRRQYRGYETVHVALSDDHRRWVVLCDAVPHTALKRAIVVELDAGDGTLLLIRKPIN